VTLADLEAVVLEVAELAVVGKLQDATSSRQTEAG
jgi:hypothetical protein